MRSLSGPLGGLSLAPQPPSSARAVTERPLSPSLALPWTLGLRLAENVRSFGPSFQDLPYEPALMSPVQFRKLGLGPIDEAANTNGLHSELALYQGTQSRGCCFEQPARDVQDSTTLSACLSPLLCLVQLAHLSGSLGLSLDLAWTCDLPGSDPTARLPPSAAPFFLRCMSQFSPHCPSPSFSQTRAN